MQITLNKIAFDVKPVDGALRKAILSDPMIRKGIVRSVWAWDKDGGQGSFLVPVSPEQGVPLPTAVVAYVPKAVQENGAGIQKADGPTTKMAERFLGALGAKSFGQVMQALSRVAGLPQRKVPFEVFKEMNDQGSYTIFMVTEFAVLELSNASRNLTVYALVPSLVSFAHAMKDAPAEAPKPGSLRPGYVIQPVTQAAQTMRRIAVAKRLNELREEMGDLTPADIAENDPRRGLMAVLGAEWRAVQPKKAQAA